MCAQLLTCSTRRVFEKLVEIVTSRVTCSNGFSSFKISRVPHISWCASLSMTKVDGQEQTRTDRKKRKKKINIGIIGTTIYLIRRMAYELESGESCSER